MRVVIDAYSDDAYSDSTNDTLLMMHCTLYTVHYTHTLHLLTNTHYTHHLTSDGYGQNAQALLDPRRLGRDES
jgi:hypothetical protein